MQWAPTDQFGNLYVANSEATDLDSLRQELRSMVEEVQARWGDEFALTLDPSFNEINAPNADHVSHVIRDVPFDQIGVEAALQTARDVLAEAGIDPSSAKLA